jgi:nitroimidazol reductase NimA-like FMN-containing flavoprotein (pyridoxamine 5'-phosphate oxidase superfamily)
VAFEVDGYDVEASTAWSVVVKGTAQEILRLYDVLAAFELPLFPWHSSPKPHFIRIEPDSITGRRFQVTGDPRSPLVPPLFPQAADE